MRVVPEDVLLSLLGRCLSLSQEVHAHLAALGSAPVPKPLLHTYAEILADLHREKRHDSVLTDESWEWIWESPEGINHFQLYGRLAWLNYNLFDLL